MITLAMIPGTRLTADQAQRIQRAYLAFDYFNSLGQAVLQVCVRAR